MWALDRPWKRACAAALSAALLFPTVGLHPIWPLAWIAPAPLLAACLWASRREAWLLSFAAALVAHAGIAGYLHTVGTPVWVVLPMALAWAFTMRATQALVLAGPRWYSVYALPLVWAGLETLIAALSPHGSWTSLAYTQMDFAPVLQVAALAGAAGVSALVMLGASTLAMACRYGAGLQRPLLAYGLPLVLIGVAVGAGALRLARAPPPPTLRVGLAAIDEFIGGHVPPAVAAEVYAAYEHDIAVLARDGAALVVLPEKIEVLDAQSAGGTAARLAATAVAAATPVLAGFGVHEGGQLWNRAWLFTPGQARPLSYDKQFPVPGLEWQFAHGHQRQVTVLRGNRLGIAICKDMDFTALTRAYARDRVAALLVPGWDFGSDGWLHGRMAVLRGVESGYTVIRSAREGRMVVSDRFGRVVLDAASAPLPGARAVVDAPLGSAQPTPYARRGDVFGWGCALLALAWRLRARVSR